MKYRRHLKYIFSVLFILVMSGCNSLFYYPDHKVYHLPSEKNLKYEDVYFKSRDNTTLHGWFVPATGDAIGTVIHFHGNAQNLSAHFAYVDWLPENGFNVFAFDYRGYGRSEGKPGRRGVYDDCKAAIEYIKTRTDIDQNRLFILGQSLGGANALAVLGRNKFPGIRAVAADSAFYSYRTIVKDKIGRIPCVCLLHWPLSFLFVTNTLSPGNVVDRISPTPVLFIHGTRDQVVPYTHAKKLYNAAKEPKYLWTIKGGRHTQAFARTGSFYKKQLVEFFKDAVL